VRNLRDNPADADETAIYASWEIDDIRNPPDVGSPDGVACRNVPQ